MSGDVQPRKRKDKKKKHDEASHGVDATKMGSDDVLLHLHEEHDTGGNWWAKIIFFSIMAALMSMAFLIILQNRGLSNVDTPLSESRFSNYFNGWVDEHRKEHDNHHDSQGSVEHDDHEENDEHDDEDDHDEPFEEEVDHSEGDEEVAEEEDDNVTPEEEDEDGDNVTAENVTAEDNEEEDDEDDITAEVDDNITAEDENVTNEENTAEQTEDNDEDEDEDEGNDDDVNKTNEDEEDDNVTTEASNQPAHDDDDAFDEEDDDDTFDSLEKIFDNDAAELELLEKKARQQAADESKQNLKSAENDIEDNADSAPSWASSQIKPKTGGGPQSVRNEEADYFEQELRRANDEMMRQRYDDALHSYDRLIKKYPDEPQVYLGIAQTMDYYAEHRQSNQLLMKAIELYNTYLQFNVNDDQLLEYRSAAERCMERMRLLGQYEESLSIHHRLIDIFPREPSVRNQLAITLLTLNRLSDAKKVLQEILERWPQDGLASVNYGFVLIRFNSNYYYGTSYLRQGIESNAEGTQDGRFYLLLGESLQRMGQQEEAMDVFRKGADLKLFPSVYQRSLYNVANLKAKPFWSLEETTYKEFFQRLENNWQAIQAEGLNLLSKDGYFLDESEDLIKKGDWKKFELYSRGKQIQDNCLKAPITCSLIAQFPAARDCRRGQIKFSVMHPGTRIRPHCGPTNCRLRAHLGLVVPSGTHVRVADQERLWQEGKFLIFDDSFEHEVWHEGQNLRLVLIVDVWHPQLTVRQRNSLSSI